MTQDVTPEALRWRDELAQTGFSDDGVQLRGPVAWQHPQLGDTIARVEIEAADFPFAPPQVRVLDPGTPLELTFHIDRAKEGRSRGNLCLWEDTWSADAAPWRSTEKLTERVAGWLRDSALGWPEDRDCDLERYLPREDTLVLYDADTVLPGLARAQMAKNGAVRIGTRPPGPALGARRPAGQRKRKAGGRPPNDLGWVWVCDVGAVDSPIRSWGELLGRLGADAERVKHEAEVKRVQWMLVQYSRGGALGVLALHLHVSGSDVEIRSCEAADTSVASMTLRAGPAAAALAEVRVAIVGCGAVGSFVADLLFRSGLRHLDLRDHETLRPGNVVRHLAGMDEVGLLKVEAVRRSLAKIDPDVATVEIDPSGVWTLEQAVAVLEGHDLVVDATGNARASSLLSNAADRTEKVVVSACVQREGGVARVDRMPPRACETYLPALTRIDDDDHPRERGCGSPVSLTPPGAVVAAAELACRVVVDELSGARSLPASVADVRAVQPEAPFDRLGLVPAAVEAGAG